MWHPKKNPQRSGKWHIPSQTFRGNRTPSTGLGHKATPEGGHKKVNDETYRRGVEGERVGKPENFVFQQPVSNGSKWVAELRNFAKAV